MNLEQLTKHQIVLLTLLVSFVTSIATGIVTVSLMDQAPAGVTRVVNQIVEHTVQTVIPATQSASAAAATTEKTVVVKDDDLTAQSIATVQKSIVRIVAAGDDTLITRGVIVDSKGTAVADRSSLAASSATSFEAILASGDRVPATVRSGSASSSVAVVDISVGTSTGFAAATLASAGKLALGQSVIAITGAGSDRVGSGVIASLPDKDSPGLIDATVAAQTPGALLMTIFGEVIGITTGDSAQAGATFYTVLAAPSAPAAATSTPASP
ncbi:MAG TPA: hypothetical protein VG934_02785 [Candidatus Paceibacterota bacterium]|nr:hypothetical protein [Candidatus Paceibacterota bacterium]